MTDRRLAYAAGAALLLLPWLAFTRVANPGYVTAHVFVDTPQYLFTVAGLAVLGLWIASCDPWLGAFALFVTASSVLRPSDLGLATAHWVTLAAAGICLMEHLGPRGRDRVVDILVASGLLEVLYAAIQVTKRDLLFFGLTPLQMIMPVGTLGNPKYLGAMLAMIAPLAPLWTLPLFLVGIAISGSVLAAVALLVGLVVRHGLRPRRWYGLGVFILIAAVYTSEKWLNWFHGFSYDSVTSRLATWHLSLQAWWWKGWVGWLVGAGFGTWFVDIPKLQVQRGINPAEVFFQGHNEYIELLYEGGLASLVILAGWVLSHRWDWDQAPALPSLAVLAVLCGGLHVFHIPTLAPTALLIVALCGIGSWQTSPPGPPSSS